MKKTIRCYFVCFGTEESIRRRCKVLFDEYDVVIDEKKPDYVIYSTAGGYAAGGIDHIRYNHCIKIFLSDENDIPNFNDCDYAMSLAPITLGDRFLRIYTYDIFQRSPLPPFDRDTLLNRRFCNFVYSNNQAADPTREHIYQVLSKYKKIDSAGSLFNNMGNVLPRRGWKAKIDFLSRYKFTLAIENSSHPGYTTEKIFHPFLAHSLPIYWGNPNVSLDWNPNSFVNLMNYSSIEEGIEEVIRLDQDDEAYLEKMSASFWKSGDSFEDFQKIETKRVSDFFHHIFDQPLSQARRRPVYGHRGVVAKIEERIARNTSLKEHLKYRVLRKLGVFFGLD
ncbi:glycosyltransferase family 10 domain-containing protein [Parabacteroides sp.]